MNSRIVFLITVCFQLLSIPTTVAQNGFIYGKVILKNGQTFQGQLRWKNREAMWHHIFDGDKSDRPYQNLLSTEESQKLQSAGEDFKFGFMALWEDRNPDQNFVFRCQFGNLVKLVDLDQGRVALYLKNGQRIYLVDDQDDLDTQIVIVDKNIGTQEFGFSAVQEIQFKSAPRDLDNAFGEPVYGKIMTSNGTFEGYITWDDEECLGDDVINGKNKGQSLAIRFRDISQIKAERDGAMVTLRNGKELFLNDHDDVDRGNHGITIHGLAFGTLEVNWRISYQLNSPDQKLALPIIVPLGIPVCLVPPLGPPLEQKLPVKSSMIWTRFTISKYSTVRMEVFSILYHFQGWLVLNPKMISFQRSR